MKKILKFTLFCALTAGLMASCDPTGETEQGLGTPTGLTVGTVTETSAELSWTAVENAVKYQVALDEGEPVDVPTASYQATGLADNTTYSWKVRAVNGDITGNWSESSQFTTPEIIIPVVLPPTDLAATEITDATAILTWKHSSADSHEVIVNDGDPVTVTTTKYEATGLTPVSVCTWKVRSCKGGIWSEWRTGEEFTTGEVAIYLGTLTNFYYMELYPNHDNRVDAWLITVLGEGVSISGGRYMGNGWVFLTQMNAPKGTGTPMFDGVYRIDGSHSPLTAVIGYINTESVHAGTWALRIRNNAIYESTAVMDGTLTSTYSDGEYTILVEGMDIIEHIPIKGTLKGAPAN